MNIFVWTPGREDRWPEWLKIVYVPTSLCCFFWPLKIFGYFTEVPVTKITVSAPAPYKNPTVKKACMSARSRRQLCPTSVTLHKWFLCEVISNEWQKRCSVTRKRGCYIKALFAQVCRILRKFALFCRHEKKAQKRTKKAQKRAKMYQKAPFCTDTCNTPVYFSVHPSCITWSVIGYQHGQHHFAFRSQITLHTVFFKKNKNICVYIYIYICAYGCLIEPLFWPFKGE